ncbi:MAG: antitoxin VapB family protein [Candidatus Thorarchaeota archaeon]|nr:antitoxin VapB family protein [Candidatus Thorarchaeota archaeon]
MARNIAVSEDVYRELRALKREGESFSDVLRRLLRRRSRLTDLAGSMMLSSDEWAKMREIKEKQTELDEARTKHLLEEMSEV